MKDNNHITATQVKQSIEEWDKRKSKKIDKITNRLYCILLSYIVSNSKQI